MRHFDLEPLLRDIVETLFGAFGALSVFIVVAFLLLATGIPLLALGAAILITAATCSIWPTIGRASCVVLFVYVLWTRVL
jgi:hypothetical protein